MVFATLSLTVPIEKRGEVVACFQAMAGPTQVQPGCLSSHFFQDLSEEGTFGLIQEWENREHLVRFLRSREYRVVLEVIELASASPKIEFFEVSHLQGLDLIEEARLPKS